MERTLLNTDEVAKVLKVDKLTLWEWHKKGILSYIVLDGGLVRYDPADVESLIKKKNVCKCGGHCGHCTHNKKEGGEQ